MSDRSSPLLSAARWVVGAAAVALVVFAFARVGLREWAEWTRDRSAIELTVLHWGDQNEDRIVAELIAEFQRRNPGIRVRRTNVGSVPQLATKLQTMLAAGKPPDLFYLESERVADLASKGVLADLEPYLRADSEAAARGAISPEGEPPLDLDDFFAPVVQAFRYDGQRIGAGALYGIPKDFTTVGFYYNKDLLRRAGVPMPPADAWTWDEFIAAARAVGKLPDCYGADFVTWEAMVRIYLFTYGVDFVTPGFASLRLDDPRVVEALTRLRGWFNEGRTLLSAKTQLETGQEPFLGGNVGLAGPFGRWKVPTYRNIRSFEWDFAPLPHAADAKPANGVLTVAWAMSAQAPHPKESWELVRFLCGRRGQEMMCEQGLAIPVLKSVAESACFTNPAIPPQNDAAFVEAAKIASYVEWPADPRFRDRLKSAMESVYKLDKPVEPTLAAFARDWGRMAGEAGPVPWGAIGVAAVLPLALLAAVLGFAWWRSRPGALGMREELAGWALLSPWVVGFLIFTAFPVGMSLLLAFLRWTGLETVDKAQWVGWHNFKTILFDDGIFRRSLWITSWYALLAVPSSQIAALAAALLLAGESRFTSVLRALWYLPSVLAGVGMAILWKWVFHHEHGLLNEMLAPLLGLFGREPPRWLESDAETWGVPAFAILNLWLIGGTMMIYLAGLKGIPRELYEAAEIDGATGGRRFLNVTLPMLSPVIFFNVIMAIIASFQIFTQVFVMTGGGPGEATHFYVYYIYKKAFDLHDMGYASAMAWLLLLLVLGLTVTIMRGTRRYVYYEALKA